MKLELLDLNWALHCNLSVVLRGMRHNTAQVKPCMLSHAGLGGSAKSYFKNAVGTYQRSTQRHEGVAAPWSPAFLLRVTALSGLSQAFLIDIWKVGNSRNYKGECVCVYV